VLIHHVLADLDRDDELAVLDASSAGVLTLGEQLRAGLIGVAHLQASLHDAHQGGEFRLRLGDEALQRADLLERQVADDLGGEVKEGNRQADAALGKRCRQRCGGQLGGRSRGPEGLSIG